MNPFYTSFALFFMLVLASSSFAQVNGEPKLMIQDTKEQSKRVNELRLKSAIRPEASDRNASSRTTIAPKRVSSYKAKPMTPDQNYSRATKLVKPTVTPISAIQKTPEEEISDIERKIEQLNISNDPMKVQKLEKLEKLLERKKWLKFSKD